MNDIEVIDPVTIPISGDEYQEIQTERFKNSINEILGFDVHPKIEFSEMLLCAAELNFGTPLFDTQLLHLLSLAESWNQDLSIAHSNFALKIKFKLKTT